MLNYSRELNQMMESFMVSKETLAEWCMISSKTIEMWLNASPMTEEEFKMITAILYLHESLQLRDAEIERLDKYLGVNI